MAYREFVGVYNAEGSLLGEIRYVVGKLTGTRSCALCDISHVLAAEKESFTAFKENFPAPFFNRHLDELEAGQLELAKDRAPCILGLDDDGWQVVLTRQHLEQCDKSVKKFRELMYSLLT
ncbi:hypothetical protein [Bacterioplanoides sp.]|uniref:hypothetical protein n=1 Tax=Bacterioplanoides sp. TaxID=2066072 RepID=UPI003B5BE39F